MTIQTKILGNLKTIMKKWFYDKTETDTQIQLLQDALDNLVGFNAEVVNTLPASGESGVIYLKPADTTTEDNIYNEYIYVNNDFELIGNTSVDLTRYATTEALNNGLNGKSDSNHNHDSRYYTESEIDNKLQDLPVAGHTHDDRYYTESEIDSKLNGKASTSVVTTSANGLMSKDDKTKLNNIAANANNYSLPTASSNTKGGVKIGSNLSMSGDTLSATNTTYSNATTSTAGLMSKDDKVKLNGVSAGANNYTLPTASASTLGGVKVDTALSSSSTNPVQNKVISDIIKAMDFDVKIALYPTSNGTNRGSQSNPIPLTNLNNSETPVSIADNNCYAGKYTLAIVIITNNLNLVNNELRILVGGNSSPKLYSTTTPPTTLKYVSYNGTTYLAGTLILNWNPLNNIEVHGTVSNKYRDKTFASYLTVQ